MFKFFIGQHRLAAQVFILTLGWVVFPVLSQLDEEDKNEPLILRYADNSQDAYYGARDAYFIQILELAAKYSDTEIKLIPVKAGHRVESRIAFSMDKGELDAHWMHTNRQVEAQLLPIRIPLYKGLIGWRLMLIRQEDSDLLKDVTSLESLRQFSVLQSFDWPDTPILKASGFSVESAVEFRSLFRMLRHRRADIFPRSIVEIWGELDDQPDLNLMVDTNIALFYPTAYYFFVARGNVKLRDAIEQGLLRAIESGDFERHFQQSFASIIEKANLSKRTLITIENPDLPPLTPLDDKALWFSP